MRPNMSRTSLDAISERPKWSEPMRRTMSRTSAVGRVTEVATHGLADQMQVAAAAYQLAVSSVVA